MYDDYPILSNEDYLQINAQYSAKNTYDFSSNLQAAISHLKLSKQFSFNPIESLNPALASKIVETNALVDTILENITLTFNVKISGNNSVSEFNVFAFLNELILAAQNLNTLQISEQKIYYKTFAQKSINQLLNQTSQIVELLKKSNVKLFKYI